MGVTTLDLVIFFGSLITVMALGLWAGRKEETSDDYFLAGHKTRWWGVAGSIFGSNVSANHIVGMLGVGFTFGFAQSHFEITAIAGLMLLCYGFLPVYRKLKVYTLSEYLGRRYDDSSRVAYAMIMVIIMVVIMMVPGFYIGSRFLNVLTRNGQTASAKAVVNSSGEVTEIKISNGGVEYASAPEIEIDAPPGSKAKDETNQAVAVAQVSDHKVSTIEVSSGGSGYNPEAPPQVVIKGGASFDAKLSPGDTDPFWYKVGILIMAVVTGSYVIFGGLKAVIITDVIQSVLMLVAAMIVAVVTFSQLGGWGTMLSLDSAAETGKMHLYLPSDHPALPWTGVLGGLMVLHFYYWGANQFIVQRALSTQTAREARFGIITAGFFKLLIPFMSIGTGIAAFYLFRKLHIHADQDIAFPMLMMHVVAPVVAPGIIGLIAAGIVGAILSSLDSMMNSAATIVTFDIYKRYMNPEASEKRLILIGRIWIVIFIIAAASITIFTMDPNSKESFFLHIASHQSKMIAGVIVAFGLGMLWRRATGAGAITAIVAGVVISYALPPLYSNYVGTTNIEQIFRTTVSTKAPNSLTDEASVMFHKRSKKLPSTKPAIQPEEIYFVRTINDKQFHLYKTSEDAGSENNPISFNTPGKEVVLYSAERKQIVGVLGTSLNFMHSVFIAAFISLILHVGISLMTQPDAEKSKLTWTGLGGHDPAVLKKAVAIIGISLVLFTLLAVAMVNGLSPLVAAIIAAVWTWAMFFMSALSCIKKAKASGTADGESATVLWKEDRFWAGLLAATAIFMMFYFY